MMLIVVVGPNNSQSVVNDSVAILTIKIGVLLKDFILKAIS